MTGKPLAFLCDIYVKIKGKFKLHFEGQCRNRTPCIGSFQMNMRNWRGHTETMSDAEVLFVLTVLTANMNFVASLSFIQIEVAVTS